MLDKLNKIKQDALDALEKVKDSQVLRDLEIQYMGRKGELTAILRQLSAMTESERRDIGRQANAIKQELQDKFNEIKAVLDPDANPSDFVDVTLPGQKIGSGHLHPITIVQKDLEDFFTSLGFMVLDGPELESDYYNFEALNIPPTHPARDMQDTFYIDPSSTKSTEGKNAPKDEDEKFDLVLRTHTSNTQVRAMQKYGVPLRAIAPGRCFRSEATDVRHEHTFYQIEGLMVDKNISVAHLKGVLEEMARHLYGPETKVRLRPKFYPFVEPGFNGEVTCFLCNGKGCRLCKQTGWLELFGAGMIHPNVLRAGRVDPEIYSGFAFGFGLNRIVQLKYNIEDIRLFNSGDLRFLSQF